MTGNRIWSWDSAWPAPAKINLFLHVVGRRADGYHLLQTVFRFIDRADTLRFEPRRDGEVVLATPTPGVSPSEDLTVRAAQALRAATGSTRGATIHLEKRLPMGGGLGGGSSDAATVLLALNHLWELHLPRARLQEIGLKLGADVPVFIFGRNTFAEGIGEAFTPVALPTSWYVILEPACQVPTATIFLDPALRRDTPAMNPLDWRPGDGRNDLEEVACRHFPAVAHDLAWLRQRNSGALMTGSGACVFAPCASQREAAALHAALPETMRGWLVQGLAAHPLADLA